MKLIRFGARGQEKPGVLMEDGSRRDLSAHFTDWDRAFWNANGPERVRTTLRPGELPLVSEKERWAAPIARPGKIVCIGLNYSDHAAETGAPIPTEPIVFLKAPNTVIGPYDEIEIPRASTRTDWEVELGVIVGRDARYLNSAEEARGYIAGYVLTHDVSERAFQMERGDQWIKGKSCDTFNPLGPFVLTPDELPDPMRLSMHLDVNGVRRQTGNTSTMIFDVFALVHYLSQFMPLEAGDLISTGTPPGVGLGMKPQQYLNPGDVVELSIDGLGTQQQRCIAAQ